MLKILFLFNSISFLFKIIFIIHFYFSNYCINASSIFIQYFSNFSDYLRKYLLLTFPHTKTIVVLINLLFKRNKLKVFYLILYNIVNAFKTSFFERLVNSFSAASTLCSMFFACWKHLLFGHCALLPLCEHFELRLDPINGRVN